MPVSFSGLDLSWLDKPENRLPPRKKPKTKVKSKRSSLASPYFVADIRPFVSPVGETPEVISSRPQLREHEKKHNVFQFGDYKPGEIGAKNEAKRQKVIQRAKAQKVDWV